MTTNWARATSVTPVGEGLWETDLDPGWSVGGGVNGGYQMAVVGRALAELLPGKPHPFAFSAHFLSAGVGGPGQITTRVLREGRAIATVLAELAQGDETRLSVLATLGDLASLDDEVSTTATPFEIAPREACVPASFAPPEFKAIAPLLDRFELLLDPGCVGWAVGDPSGRGDFRAWFRVSEEDVLDPVQLLMAVDALPPVTFDLGRPGWAPTLELTAHLRALPAPGWLRVRHCTRNVAGGMFEEDCEVWDSAGRLVAQSRQLARVPRSGAASSSGTNRAAGIE